MGHSKKCPPWTGLTDIFVIMDNGNQSNFRQMRKNENLPIFNDVDDGRIFRPLVGVSELVVRDDDAAFLLGQVEHEQVVVGDDQFRSCMTSRLKKIEIC